MTMIFVLVLLVSSATWASALEIEVYRALSKTQQELYIMGFADGVVQGFPSDPDRKVVRRIQGEIPGAAAGRRCDASYRTLHSMTQDFLNSATPEALKDLRLSPVEHVVWMALEQDCPTECATPMVMFPQRLSASSEIRRMRRRSLGQFANSPFRFSKSTM